MNVLILNGSPKGENSNTLKLTKSFCEGIVEETAATVKTLSVNKMNIKDCIGCFSCWSKTPGVCCLKDDMAEIIEELVKSDVVIWSFPLYFFSLPSRLKALMDRQLPMFLPFMASESKSESGGHPSRYDLSGKRYVVISTCGFYTSIGNYNAVDEQFERMYGKDGYTSLYCGEGELFRVPELTKRTNEYLEFVKNAGSEFIKGKITDETREDLYQLLYPRDVFEQMADADWGVQATSNQNEPAVDISLNFTKQMAALYNKSAWNGTDKVLEFHYTDLDKTYQLHLKKDGQTVLVDNFLPYTTRIETPFSVWRKIGSGGIDGHQALMQHLYSVKGDFEIMIKWDEYFGYNSNQLKTNVQSKTKVQKTNMGLVLTPWIAIWIALSIDHLIGGIIGILISAALPIAFLKWKATVFEYITIIAVTVFSLLSILGFSVKLLLPVSYLFHGLMWGITVFLKIPFTAYYSMNDYNGEKALSNPLFIKTNRILTAVWSVFYIVTPVWTYLLLLSPVSHLTGVVNSVLPFLLGIFTTWFQKWYPGHYASKGSSISAVS